MDEMNGLRLPAASGRKSQDADLGRATTLAASPLLLCIDDEALGLQIRKAVLERAGYRVITALDGASGLTLFWDQPVSAVVLDYFMPGMDGSQVAAEMRKRRAEVPILLLTAHINLPPEVVTMVDYTLLKGEGPQELLAKIGQMLNDHGDQADAHRESNGGAR
jgi:DNA-binding response OmpR family regulator